MGTYHFSQSIPFYDNTSDTTSASAVSSGYTQDVEQLAAPSSVGAVQCSYALSGAAAQVAQESVAAESFVIKLTKNSISLPIVPGSVRFSWAGHTFYDRLGAIYAEQNCNTGAGVLRGSIDYLTGIVSLDVFDGGDNTIEVHSLAGRLGSQYVTDLVFRTPGAPLRPGSLTLACVTADGVRLSATAGVDGAIDGDGITGGVDYETGIVAIGFGEMVADSAEYVDESWYNADLVENGEVWKPTPVYADSFEYACVVYSYIPLDASLIGVNPVRLPTDGRVAIVKAGDVVVVHNTVAEQLATGLTAGQEITLNRDDISVVRLYDADGLYVPTTYYSFDVDSQVLTMADPLDLSGFTEPLIANHRREDMALVSGVQINGQITLARGLKHDYPVAGTFVSSALLFGDIQSRVYNLFDQKTWTSEWSNDLIGDASTANFNDIDYPITCTNKGAVKERWAIYFDSSDGHVQVIGEKYGVVLNGYITNIIQPINAATGEPFFRIPIDGWGSGWSAGNVLRFNTEAADGHMWVCRTTLQGEETEAEDQFTIQIRGDNE